MAFRKKSLRRFRPTARKLARIINDLDSVRLRLKGMVEVMDAFEGLSKIAGSYQKNEGGYQNDIMESISGAAPGDVGETI